MHQHRPRRPRRLRVEVVADHDIRDSLPGKGIRQPGGWSSGGEKPLHRIQRADRLRRCERDRVAHTPRAAAEYLKRLVVAGSPHLRGERRARRHQHAPGGEPELCSSSQAAVWCQYGGIASNAPGGVSRPVHASEVPVANATSTTMPTATRLSFSGWAKACTHSRRGTLPGSGMRPSRWARPSTNGNRISGSSLCTLRSGVPAGVEKRLNRMCQRRSEAACVSGRQQGDADQQDRHQPAAGRHRAHRQPGQPGRRDQRGGQHRNRPGDQRRARGGVRARRTGSSCRCRAAPR